MAASWDRLLVAAGRIGTWALYLRCLGSVVGAHGLSCPVACGILVPQPGIEPASLTLEGIFVTTGLRSVKSPCAWVWNEVYLCCPHLLLPSCIHRSVLGFGTWGLRAWSVPRAWSSSKMLWVRQVDCWSRDRDQAEGGGWLKAWSYLGEYSWDIGSHKPTTSSQRFQFITCHFPTPVLSVVSH